MGGDACPIVNIEGAHVQENGIIRLSNGRYIGRIEGITYEEIKEIELARSAIVTTEIPSEA